MKPIIMDMRDMSDSTEVYESRPNPFMIYFIYVLLIILLTAFTWAYFAKLDIVVKSNGMFRSEEAAVDVSSGISGKVMECNITEGQYVEEGDVLFTIDSEVIKETIARYDGLLAEVEERIAILEAYNKYLEGSENALELCAGNEYYLEFANRKQLLELNMQNSGTNTDLQEKQYQQELTSVTETITRYEEQLKKLNQVVECVKNRHNTFTVEESYYESIVSSYISNYYVTAAQYDMQIEEYQKQITDIEGRINAIESQVNAMTVSEATETEAAESDKNNQSDKNKQSEKIQNQTDVLNTQPISVAAVSGSDSINTLNSQKTEYQNSITNLTWEKDVTLRNIEFQQLATLNQQIETINNSLSAAKSNQSMLQAQLEILNNEVQDDNTSERTLLTEKQNIATELLNYESKKTEYENALKQYDLENGNAKVTATASGYISLSQEINRGSYISQGSTLCKILPENSSGYYAEIYVENKDIAKLVQGQEVKFEIAAYPSGEYGYFTGVIDSISKDIKVEQSTGSAYYLVKVKCGQTTITNKEGKTGSIMNGMACQAKVVVDEQNVLGYLLEKLNLLD